MLQAHAYFIGHFVYVLSDNHVTIGSGTLYHAGNHKKNKVRKSQSKAHFVIIV